MRWLVGSSCVACSYFEMASSRFDPFALSPSLARLTASMLLRLQPAAVAAIPRHSTTSRRVFERIVILRERGRSLRERSAQSPLERPRPAAAPLLGRGELER